MVEEVSYSHHLDKHFNSLFQISSKSKGFFSSYNLTSLGVALDTGRSRFFGLENHGSVGRNLHNVEVVFDGGRVGQEKL